MLTKKYGTRVVAPRTVAARLRGMLPAVADYIDVIRTLEPFTVGGAEVTAFHTLHDTDESVGYRIEADGASFGFCTDLGCLTDEVLDAMCGVEAAVIESNYDEQMLCDGRIPCISSAASSRTTATSPMRTRAAWPSGLRRAGRGA